MPASPAEGRIAGILLAAGAGRRFGGDKLLQPRADGTPLAVGAARALAGACERRLAVVGPDSSAALCEALRAEGYSLCVAAEAAHGMGMSLARGVAAAPGADGWLIALADMPLIRAETMRSVARALQEGASIAAPFHAGRRGHPVGFGAEWFDALCRLEGDQGARTILAKNAERITRVEVDDPGVLLDVDTPADLAALAANQSACRAKNVGLAAAKLTFRRSQKRSAFRRM